jgi:peptidyl-prolyl cis-trans isomerase SurA
LNDVSGGREMPKLKSSLIVVFLLIAASSRAGVLLDRVVAVVNQEVITWSELYKSMESEASPQLKEMKDNEKRQVFMENEAFFLETLVGLKLQLQEARNLGVNVSEEELKDGIDNIKKKYSMTDSAFMDSLKKEGYTFEGYKRRLREQIMISKVVNMQIRSKILASDADVKKFIEENKEFSESGEGYRLSQIFFKKPKNDGEKSSVEEKAALVLKKLKEGIDFSDLAKQYSEDNSAASGGDLGLIKKSQMAREFAEALSVMKPGETSIPFWTSGGLHIIKLNEKSEARSPEQIKEEAKTAFINKTFMERYAAWMKGLREKAYIEIRL